MATRINDNVRAEWDSIDLENDETREHKAHSPTTKAAKDRNEGPKAKGNAKNLTLSSRKTRKSPTRKHQSKPSELNLDDPGLTQDCITLEPGPSIQSPYPWLKPTESPEDNVSPVKQSATNGAPRVLHVSDKERATANVHAVVTVNEILGLNSDSSSDEGSINESGREPASNGQKLMSSVDETEESSTDDDESKLGSPFVVAPEGIRLPIDSDDEEFKAAKERRVQAYAKNGQSRDVQSPPHGEKRWKQASVSVLQGNSINLASSTVPSTPTEYNHSQQSSMLPPLQAKKSTHSEDINWRSPFKGNQIPIPVFSSTGASQNSLPSKPDDMQVQRTPLQSKMRDSETSDQIINTILYPTLPSMTSVAIDSNSKSPPKQTHSKTVPSNPPLEQNHPTTAPFNLPRPASASATLTSTSPRKHPRPSLKSSREPSSSPRKRQRISSPIAIPQRPQSTRVVLPPIMTSTPGLDLRYARTANPVSQHSFPQGSSRSMPSTPGTASTNPPTPNIPRQPTYPTPMTFINHIQGQNRPSYEHINYSHTLPPISASQPVPQRPRILQAAQTTTPGFSPQTRMFPTEVARQAVATNAKVPELPRPLILRPIELDLEPLTIILDLRGIDYSMAVQNSRVYSGLQSLFCEFLATYLTYLGTMDHLFNLCIWLLRSAIDPSYQRERINEVFWDDFILQHQEGKYNTYVQHCLARVRQPGSWAAWYQQAQKYKPAGNVVTSIRLQNILLGREFATPKRKIPLLMSRFMSAQLRRVNEESS